MSSLKSNLDVQAVEPITATSPHGEPSLHLFGTEERGAQMLFFISDRPYSKTDAEKKFAPFSAKFRIAVLLTPLPSVTEVISVAETIEQQLLQVGTKRTTVIGAGAGTPLAQALGALFPDVVRRLVLIDPTARVTPGLLLRTIDRVEHFLPFGLPLRPLTDEFDSRPLLHRIRCPVLVIRSNNASKYIRDQALLIASKIPNARIEDVAREGILSKADIEPGFVIRLLDFLQVPAKRPQKNIGGS